MAEAVRDRSWYDQFGMPNPTEYGGGSTGSSSSSSTPTVVRTPENDILDQISGVAQGLAGQMLGWAQNVFANTSRVTDQAVGNFFDVSNKMMGLSNNLTDQYNNIFSQQNASLAKEANEYNSVGRQKVDMGRAGATAQQAGDAALKSSEEALRSYGINPTDGRYAALDKAAAVQNAANVAGAMNMQREKTAEVGRGLRSQAVQVGAMLPAAIANVNNTAIQANTGASNATLANANTGANLNRLPNEYLKTAMDLKLPPVGQTSQSQSRQQAAPHPGGATSSGGSGGGPRGGGSGGGAGRAGGAGGGQGGQAWMPNHGDAQEHGGRGGVNMRQGGSSIQPAVYGGVKGYAGDANYDVSGITDALNGSDFSYLNEPDYDYGTTGQQNTWGDPGYSDTPFNNYDGNGSGAFGSYDFGQNGWDDTYGGGGDYQTFGNQDYGAFDNNQGWTNSDNIGYDAGANAVDPGWDQSYNTPVDTDWGGWSSGGNEAFNDYGMGFREGGPVQERRKPRMQLPMPRFAGGGQVPTDMSPSGGQAIDDVPAVTPNGPARLNANEFVIPQDVAMWKGQEFFQNLINKSRQARVMAPAQGGQPQPGM